MFDIIKSWRTKSLLRKQLLAFLDEMEKNLEIFYVMDQRQFIIHGYSMDVWEKVKDLNIIKSQEAIKTYAVDLIAFNNAFKEHKEYEKWYTSDVQNKNVENGKKLHDLKNKLDARIKPLEAVIIAAGQALEKELLNLGFINN